MITVIYGGSGSGKSAYAEKRALEIAEEKLYYLATMQVYDKEGKEKVKKHRKMRQGKGFVTIEQPVCIEETIRQIERESVVLLECLSNLTANEMFCKTKRETAETVISKVLSGIHLLEKHVGHLLIVTNNIFEDGMEYDQETMQYMEALGAINSRLADVSDELVEVVVGIPIKQKGER